MGNEHIRKTLETGKHVIMDGPTATLMERFDGPPPSDKTLWGTWALYNAPNIASRIHRAYTKARCDVITAMTWAVTQTPIFDTKAEIHWIDIAQRGVKLARSAIKKAGKEKQSAVAFSINGHVKSEDDIEKLKILTRALGDDQPDIFLLETIPLFDPTLTLEAAEILTATNIPVWMSFRRRDQGACGIHGNLWGGPDEAEQFKESIHRFEEMGIQALLINCLPPEYVEDTLMWLKEHTHIPIGAYPNLGRPHPHKGWSPDNTIGPKKFAELCLLWLECGAQIIGGCCGTTPEHMAAAQRLLANHKSDEKNSKPRARPKRLSVNEPGQITVSKSYPWKSERGTTNYPLCVPEIPEPPQQVFPPTEGSFALLRQLRLLGETVREKLFLDIGCGGGIQTVFLAQSGAYVHAVDIERAAADATWETAKENGIEDRVVAHVADIYTFPDIHPENRAYTNTAWKEMCKREIPIYDGVIASPFQIGVDPYTISSHRPVDYWGRSIMDRIITLLPHILKDNGIAYIMHLSITSLSQTERVIETAGMQFELRDEHGFLPFGEAFEENREQIELIESKSDAYHVKIAGTDYAVAHILEITHKK